jgi:hypothetical protein
LLVVSRDRSGKCSVISATFRGLAIIIDIARLRPNHGRQ